MTSYLCFGIKLLDKLEDSKNYRKFKQELDKLNDYLDREHYYQGLVFFYQPEYEDRFYSSIKIIDNNEEISDVDLNLKIKMAKDIYNNAVQNSLSSTKFSGEFKKFMEDQFSNKQPKIFMILEPF